MNKKLGRIPAALTVGLLLLSACGTRASDTQIAAEAGGSPTTLSPAVLNQIKEAAAAGAASALGSAGGAAAAGPAAAAPAPASGGVAPAAGTATGTGAAGAPAAGAPGAATKAGNNNKVTSQSAAAPAAGSAATCTKPGTPVNVGQVGTFSGVTGPAWTNGRTAVAVWAKDINARGGLACHPVQIFFGDDGGDPARAAALVGQLSKDDHVVAFVGGHLDLSIAGFLQAIETAKVPAVGGDLIAQEWYGQSAYMFPQGASFDDQAIGIMKQNLAAGKTKVGLLYCVEVRACTYANKQSATLAKAAGVQIVYTSAISLTQTDFTAQCQSAKNAGADQLLLGMDGTAMARVARSCAAINYKPILGGFGGTISPGQATDPTLRQFNLATTSGTAPWTETSTPGLKAYHDALAQFAPGEQTSGSSVQMWTAAKLLEAAVNQLGPAAVNETLTPALVMQGLHKIRNESLGGLTTGLTFTSGLPKSTGCVFRELLTTAGWSAPGGVKPFCN